MSESESSPSTLQILCVAKICQQNCIKNKKDLNIFLNICKNFIFRLKNYIDNYSIANKRALHNNINKKLQCDKNLHDIWFCNFNSQFKPKWIAYLNIIHYLINLTNICDDSYTHRKNIFDLWRHTIASIVTIDFFHISTKLNCFDCHITPSSREQFWPVNFCKHNKSLHCEYDEINYSKFILSACTENYPVNITFVNNIKSDITLTNLNFYLDVHLSQKIVRTETIITDIDFSINIIYNNKYEYLYYPLIDYSNINNSRNPPKKFFFKDFLGKNISKNFFVCN